VTRLLGYVTIHLLPRQADPRVTRLLGHLTIHLLPGKRTRE